MCFATAKEIPADINDRFGQSNGSSISNSKGRLVPPLKGLLI